MATKKMSKPAPTGKGKASARKTAPKKSTVTGTAVKKTAGKKAAPKKLTVKKTAAKKAPVKKETPKKTAAAIKTPAPKPPAKQLDRYEIHLRISEAAYYKFVKRGYRHGQHISDWYEAVKEIISDL